MNLSIELSLEEERLLEQATKQLGYSKSDIVRQAIHELCQKIKKEADSPYSSGEDLFGMVKLADAPSDSMKKHVWEKLRNRYIP